VQDRTRLGRARRGRRGRVRGERQEQLDGVAAAIGGDEAGESVRVIGGDRRAAVVDDQRRLPEREPVDRQPLHRGLEA
jgi:hypothetical protein